MGDGPTKREPSPVRRGSTETAWVIVRPRDGFRVSWAEGSFALISVAIHVAAIRIIITGEYIVSMYKWFDATFGIPSPTSGTTRAFIALDSGHIVDAFLYNPISAIAAAFSIVFPFYLVGSIIRGKALVPTPRLRRWTTWLGLGGLFLAWIVKIQWVPEQYW
jgi:hypothetical protein